MLICETFLVVGFGTDYNNGDLYKSNFTFIS